MTCGIEFEEQVVKLGKCEWVELLVLLTRTDGFGLDFVKKIESGLWSTSPDVEAVNKRGTKLGFAYSL